MKQEIETWHGTFVGGATYPIRKVISKIPLTGLQGTNQIVFDCDPHLVASDAIVVEIDNAANYLRNWEPYLTVTATATNVGGRYIVPTSGNWAIVKEFALENVTCCGNLQVFAQVCERQDLSSFTGEVYSRPLKEDRLLLPVFVSPNSPLVIFDACHLPIGCDMTIRKGDAIFFDDTTTDFDRPATIVNLARGKTASNRAKLIATIDRPIVGITTPIIDRVARITATIYHQRAASLNFRAKGGWEVEAFIDRAVTSSDRFPLGKRTDRGQEYTFTIAGDLPNGFIQGVLVLN